jgi:DNA-binding NarL/FixJ family response regulator
VLATVAHNLLRWVRLTAKTHLDRAMTKLGVNDCAQLVITAYETGSARIGQRPGLGG